MSPLNCTGAVRVRSLAGFMLPRAWLLVVGFLANLLSASNELFAREGQNIEVYQAALCLLATFSATGTPKGITPKRKI